MDEIELSMQRELQKLQKKKNRERVGVVVGDLLKANTKTEGQEKMDREEELR